ncbi:MAG: energy-coupling factor ABC transporter permease [Nitrospirae bacterium YQR-1]
MVVKTVFLLTLLLIPVILPVHAYAMHIMEGFLPLWWCLCWYAVVLPFVALGVRMIKKQAQENSSFKLLLGVSAGFLFVVSAMKIPSVAGSCSHPTGIGLGAILFGPLPMVVLSLIVLVFQALLLAHGGVSTLGANVFSMGVIGAFVSFGIYALMKKIKMPIQLSVFLAAALGDLSTYMVTSLQLALAYPTENNYITSFLKFLSVFAVTQLPLAALEGIVTVFVFNYLRNFQKDNIIPTYTVQKENNTR